jgi:mevalonate kinase
MSQRVIRISAPGKIILHGEHSVVYGKKAIAVSVGLLTKITATLIQEKEFRAKFDDVSINSAIPLDLLQKLKDELRPDFRYADLNANEQIPIWADVQAAIGKFCDANVLLGPIDETLKNSQKIAFESLLFLYLAIFEEAVGLSITVETELPVGAGLGSSASFAVALVGGLLVAAGRIPSEKLDYDLINRWAFVSEKFMHGTPSGVDNSVATFGAGVIFQKGKDVELLKELPDIRVLLVNTKVSRSTKGLVAKVASFKETDPAIFQTCIDGIEALVDLAIREIRDGRSACSDLIAKNHEYLKTLGVSHSTLETIVEIGHKYGFSGKLTGAGGGGCAFIYIPDGNQEGPLQSLMDELKKSGFEFWDTKLGCPGVSVC